MYYTKSLGRKIADILLCGGVGVMPTDTIYGIVGSALNRKAVGRIYKLRLRNPKKPMIILIGSIADLKIFGMKTDARTRKILNRFWPGKVSFVLPCLSRKFGYLHRGTETLAFRFPKPYWLRRLLADVGPLVAPSVNREGDPPAKTIKEAKKYFGPVRGREGSKRASASNGIDFYLDGGRIVSRPSKLVKIERGKEVILRK